MFQIKTKWRELFIVGHNSKTDVLCMGANIQKCSCKIHFYQPLEIHCVNTASAQHSRQAK